MKESITVYVNGHALEIRQGARVEHALIAFNYGLYRDCLEGGIIILDENGFAVGLEGALYDGAKLEVRRRR